MARAIETSAAFGVSQRAIATGFGISRPTLVRHYREALATGRARLLAGLVTNLARLAEGDGDAACMAIEFALRARFGWSPHLPRQLGHGRSER